MTEHLHEYIADYKPSDCIADASRKGFQEASHVILRSGGPIMTVEDIRSDEIVMVVWFDAEKRCHRDGFHRDALVRVDGQP